MNPVILHALDVVTDVGIAVMLVAFLIAFVVRWVRYCIDYGRGGKQ